jgi:hypothetical protein
MRSKLEDRVRAQWSIRTNPNKLDKDAFPVGWVASLDCHQYRGWKTAKSPDCERFHEQFF